MDDVRRIERQLAMEDAGVKKPSVNDKIIAARTRAYDRGDVRGIVSADKSIRKRQAVARAARHHHKARKRALAEYCRDLDKRSQVPDPPSGGEGAGRA